MPVMNEKWGHILQQTEAYYTAKVREHGATAKGVDWNSAESQQVRFRQLLRLAEGAPQPFSLNDFGCGYGALVEYLHVQGYAFSYHGLDLSGEMVKQAQVRHGPLPYCRFSTDAEALAPADYTVASGIFNVRLDTPDEEWRAYMLATLDQLAACSTQGFAFNVLTIYSDAER